MVEADSGACGMNLAGRIDGAMSADWETKGWAVVRGFIGGDELEQLRCEANRLWADKSLFDRRGAVPNSATRGDRLDPVIDLSQPFAALARDPRLLENVSSVLGGEVQLMKDKFIAKPPGATGYAAHQDAAYWPGLGLDAHHFLTAVLFLDDSTAQKGAIECAPGFHHRLLTDPDTVADPDESELGEFTVIEAEAGDLLLLHALTPHRSGPNRSSEMRRTLLYTYGIDARPNLYAVYKQFQQGVRS